MSPAPGVIRSTASNRLGNEAIQTSWAKRRRRAPARLRTRLPPIPCGRGLTDAGRDFADAARCQATFHLAQPDVPPPPCIRASSIARDPTCERAASVRSRKFACSERTRRVRANVIRADRKTPGLIPRTTVLRVPPYATRQRQSSSERQIPGARTRRGAGDTGGASAAADSAATRRAVQVTRTRPATPGCADYQEHRPHRLTFARTT